jgi:hypothetical protein
MEQSTLFLSLIFATIGIILSYIAMHIEFGSVNLSYISWIRIFITFFITGVIVKLIEKRFNVF